MNKIEINLGKVDNSCFVVMPFSSLFQIEYEKIIQPALTELNIECVRGDEIYSKQRIVDDVWDSIKKCRFVLAELTGKNPNVLYEIGLAHAIGKPVIIITRNGDDVPFDLKALRYLFYDVNDPYWGENLKKGIQNLAKKVLENPAIESYLDGVSSSPIVYPKLSTKVAKETKSIMPQLDITGTWEGEFIDHEDIVHRVNLQINLDLDLFSCAAVISFSRHGIQTVVQQIMNINIKAENIELRGVNYTYIERGGSESYALDNFRLTFVKETNILTGIVISDYSNGTSLNKKITFKKI